MTAMMEAIAAFPNLSDEFFSIASPENANYNCIAWAIGDDRRWWWPNLAPSAYWPPGFPKDETVENFVRTFSLFGFIECQDGSLEDGFEKIVLYTKSGTPTHMARQRCDGHWWSKLGDWHDIVHETPKGIEGILYGLAHKFFKRPVPSS